MLVLPYLAIVLRGVVIHGSLLQVFSQYRQVFDVQCFCGLTLLALTSNNPADTIGRLRTLAAIQFISLLPVGLITVHTCCWLHSSILFISGTFQPFPYPVGTPRVNQVAFILSVPCL